MTSYLKTDMSKLSFAEAWRMGDWSYVLVVAGWKLRGSPRYGKVLVPASSSLLRVEEDTVGEGPRAAISPMLGELRRAGFETAFWYRVDSQGLTDSVAVVALNRAGDTLGSVIYVEVDARKRVAFSLTSVPVAGTFWTTGNGSGSFSPPRSVKAVFRPDAPAGEILEIHARRLRELGRPPLPITDAERLILDLQTAIREEHVRRGLYVPA